MSHPRSLSDSDLAEIRALFQRKTLAAEELKIIKQKQIDLQKELHELSDVAMGKDYNVSEHVIRLIRKGKTYKQHYKKLIIN